MYALLGGIQFDLVTFWDGYSFVDASKYARHEVIEGKPRLQRIGEELSELTIELAFHDFYCEPSEELDKLQDARKAGRVLPLIFGDGVVAGDFVIERLQVNRQSDSALGQPESLSATMTLIEYVEDDPLTAKATEKKKDAPGVQKPGKGKKGSKTGSKKSKKSSGKTSGGSGGSSGGGTHKETNKDGVSFDKMGTRG